MAVWCCFAAMFATCLALPAAQAQDTTSTSGCVDTGSPLSYSTFDQTDFSYLDDNLEFDTSGHLVENTDNSAIDKEKILLTSTQDVRVSLLYEGGGYVSNFGYFLLSQAEAKGYVNSDGTINYTALQNAIDPNVPGSADKSGTPEHPTNPVYDGSTFHYLFWQMQDNNYSSDDGGDGVLDQFMVKGQLTSNVTNWTAQTGKTAEDYVAQYDDGTGYPFMVNNDGTLTARDMTKDLGLIAENQEIVFFLVANGDYKASDKSIFFNKTSYNQDTYTNSNNCYPNNPVVRIYHLGQPSTEQACIENPGWLTSNAITRLSSQFGITLSPDDTYTLNLQPGDKFSHLIVGAPADDPTQWVLGWEDLAGGGDQDYNDMVFKIQRKTQARAISKVVSTAISAQPDTYITAVNFEADDKAVNCVSGVVGSVNTSFDDSNITGNWADQTCQSTSSCTVGCSNENFTGSINVSNLTFTGDINDAFTQANLTATANATVNLSFDTCERPWPKISGSGTYCGQPSPSTPAFSATVPVTISAQNVTVNSSGQFTGTFTIAAPLSLYNAGNDSCFQNWQGTLTKTITLSGQLNGDWNTRKNDIVYYISVDDGNTWTEITHWDSITTNSDGSEDKKVRIDTLNMGLVGNQLMWKAVFENNDAQCTAPELDKVDISYDASGNNSFSRADPVVLGNVLYSGSMETPAADWGDKTRLRGHMIAYQIYAPDNPDATDYVQEWDAGEELSQRVLSSDPRKIYVAMPTPQTVTGESVANGDGYTVNYQGTLAHGRILAGSLSISDGTEKFTDKGVNTLVGDKGGTGTIDRFTGAFTLTFHTAPATDVPVTASYKYYPETSGLQVLDDFSTDYITDNMLGIDDQYVQGAGYTYDFTGDGEFTDADRKFLIDWVRGFDDKTDQQREWPLGAIDHSTPAVVGPPGIPSWYYGSGIPDDVRSAFDTWVKQEDQRPTVLYVGADDGMLHAFDAGAFRQGDNPNTPGIMENRGYFADVTDSNGNTTPDYGTGKELWAFIPNNCVSRLKYLLDRNLPNADPPYVDASPSVEDVYYYDSTGQLRFKTILISAEGTGGDTVFALDVTDPDNPKFMWEYGNPALYRSKSSPPVGRIVPVDVDGSVRWVVFFVSGQTASDAYPSIFMVDALTGNLIKQISLNIAGADNKGDVLSGSPAVVDANGNGYIDRLYVGDDQGYMYRVNIPDEVPSNMTSDPVNYIQSCVLAKVPEPIYASPTVYTMDSYDESGSVISYDVKVMFGTGNNPDFYEDPNNTDTIYHFYVFDDTTPPYTLEHQANGTWALLTKNSDNTLCDCLTPMTESDATWSYALPAGQRIWATAFAAADTVYFGTSGSATEDPCSAASVMDSSQNPIYGSVYALSLSNLTSTSTANTVATNVGNVTGITVEDQHLYIKATKPSAGTNMSSFGDSTYNNPVGIGEMFVTQKILGSWQQLFQ